MIGISMLKAAVRTDSTGATEELPVLVTAQGIILPLLDYCLACSRRRSLSWMKRLLHAVRLFIQYVDAHPGEANTRALFSNFARRLHTGTFDVATGTDPSGLGWGPSRNSSAQVTISLLTGFFNHVADENPDFDNPCPQSRLGTYDRMLVEAAYQHRRESAFLGHTWPENAQAIGMDCWGSAMTNSAKSLVVGLTDPPCFPEDRFEELLFEGFKVGGRMDYRNMLITLLMHGAGFRVSEPFHLYVGDVLHDPAGDHSALVMIHHPEQGSAALPRHDGNTTVRSVTRSEYLAATCQMPPRNRTLSRLRAGWKGGQHERDFESIFMRAFWFEPKYGKLFLELWLCYMGQLIGIQRDHPFAFVNLRSPVGAPYKLSQFSKAHEAAVRRIGLPVGRVHGTHCHGHRHAYGRRLSRAGVSPQMIKRFMHHSRLESQAVYTGPSLEEIVANLRAAAERLSNS